MQNIWYVAHRPDLLLVAPCDTKVARLDGSMFVSIDHLHEPLPPEAKWRHPQHEAYLTCFGEPAKQRPRLVQCGCGQEPCLVRSQQERSGVPEEMIPKDWATRFTDPEAFVVPDHRKEAGIRMWLDCTGQADRELGDQEEKQIEAASIAMFTDKLKGRVCYECEKPSTSMKTCGRCGKARYCSKHCQSGHWKTHKAACAAVEQQPAAADAQPAVQHEAAAEAAAPEE
jgi:hypothetical protein